jgi:hypothetical protein
VAGFEAVEFSEPYGEDVRAIGAALTRNGLRQVQFNLAWGDHAAGEVGIANNLQFVVRNRRKQFGKQVTGWSYNVVRCGIETAFPAVARTVPLNLRGLRLTTRISISKFHQIRCFTTSKSWGLAKVDVLSKKPDF